MVDQHYANIGKCLLLLGEKEKLTELANNLVLCGYKRTFFSKIIYI